jgi:uncharacterized repeat protein (TIGR03806 family)
MMQIPVTVPARAESIFFGVVFLVGLVSSCRQNGPAASASRDAAITAVDGPSPDGSRDRDGLDRAGAHHDDAPKLDQEVRPANTTCKPPAAMDQPAAILSATGCVDPKDPTKPAPGLIPYEVNSPLWSDGAEKERYMALPDGGRVTVKSCKRHPTACLPVFMGGTPEDEGHWSVPAGTVLVKTFLLGGKRVETRLLVRFDAYTWVGYSYEWNEEQTEAHVHPDRINGVQKSIKVGSGTQLWHFPSRSECLQCHTEAAGVALGLDSAQLNRDFVYPSGLKANQLETLERMGIFDAPLDGPAIARYPTPNEQGTPLAERARSYLHVNCAICHRPEGNFAQMDLRYRTPLENTQLCNVEPEKGDLGVMGALRLVPGEPGKSLVSLRMHALDQERMPQLGTSVVDPLGVAVVDDWIRSLKGCP